MGTGDDWFVRVGPLEINDFSVCFWVEPKVGNEKKGVYIKIPKFNLCLQRPRKVLPITEQDRSLARNEYESLCFLSKFWNNRSPNVKFVTPLAFFDRYNVIVSEREYAHEAFRIFRRWDQSARLGLKQCHILMQGALQELAKALARFHVIWATPGSFPASNVLEKIRKCCGDLVDSGVRPTFLNATLKRLEVLDNKTFPVEMTRTLKGLDIRNILLDSSGRLVLLDPGAMTWDCREADLARFLGTLKILYWGSPFFAIGMVPKSTFFDTFIKAYYGDSPRSMTFLSLLTIKELFKQWRMGHVALAIKRWPYLVKRPIALLYIDSFYRTHIENEVIKFEEFHRVS